MTPVMKQTPYSTSSFRLPPSSPSSPFSLTKGLPPFLLHSLDFLHHFATSFLLPLLLLSCSALIFVSAAACLAHLVAWIRVWIYRAWFGFRYATEEELLEDALGLLRRYGCRSMERMERGRERRPIAMTKEASANNGSSHSDHSLKHLFFSSSFSTPSKFSSIHRRRALDILRLIAQLKFNPESETTRIKAHVVLATELFYGEINGIDSKDSSNSADDDNGNTINKRLHDRDRLRSYQQKLQLKQRQQRKQRQLKMPRAADSINDIGAAEDSVLRKRRGNENRSHDCGDAKETTGSDVTAGMRKGNETDGMELRDMGDYENVTSKRCPSSDNIENEPPNSSKYLLLTSSTPSQHSPAPSPAHSPSSSPSPQLAECHKIIEQGLSIDPKNEELLKLQSEVETVMRYGTRGVHVKMMNVGAGWQY